MLDEVSYVGDTALAFNRPAQVNAPETALVTQPQPALESGVALFVGR